MVLITWNSSFNSEIGSPLNREKKKNKLPAMMRRRLTPLGRLVVESLYDATSYLEDNQITEPIPWVISSRHGDADRVKALLTDISNQSPLSPMQFSQSVHNAIVGSFSIATKNTALHTAISAGELSFELGLLEAYVLQKSTNSFVGYSYYDTAMPEQYNDKIQGNSTAEPLCVTMILGPDNITHKDVKNIKLTYVSESIEEKRDSSSLKFVLDFFKNKEDSLRIPIPGGVFEFA